MELSESVTEIIPKIFRPLFAIGLAAVVLTSSCDKPSVLDNQRVKVQAEIQRTKDEIHSIDAKFEALQMAHASNGKSLEQRREEAVKKNTALEEQSDYLSKKCEEAEAALSIIRPRVDIYKAKYLY